MNTRKKKKKQKKKKDREDLNGRIERLEMLWRRLITYEERADSAKERGKQNPDSKQRKRISMNSLTTSCFHHHVLGFLFSF